MKRERLRNRGSFRVIANRVRGIEGILRKKEADREKESERRERERESVCVCVCERERVCMLKRGEVGWSSKKENV